MFRSPFPLTAVALAAVALPAAAAAAPGPLQISSRVMVEIRARAADGTTRLALAPARRVVPGDRVTVVLAYRNTGAQPLAGVTLDNPIPRGLVYRAPAPGSAAPAVSLDGRRYAALDQLRVALPGGGTRAAVPDDVTHVRWRLDRPLTAGGGGEFAFQAVLH
ncbi:hypothetical protein [uncultured Sphingomonas sp.]|uniref:hypothetical protein n=1 Tax=uncultured Sphingomonas sp. TaxID=158754 RepID=UPI0030DA0AB3